MVYKSLCQSLFKYWISVGDAAKNSMIGLKRSQRAVHILLLGIPSVVQEKVQAKYYDQ